MGMVETLAPAKINLHLGVSRACDEHGYHLLRTVMCRLDLADVVRVEELPAAESVLTEGAAGCTRAASAGEGHAAPDTAAAPSVCAAPATGGGSPDVLNVPAGCAGTPRIELTCEPDPVGDARANLAYRAAEALATRLGRAAHLRIVIEKRIPSQAGLGGGSSDAAAVLRCLAELWGLPATDACVVEVAQGLGADVPFFLYEGTCLLERRGDVFVERLPLPQMSLVLAKPPVGVSTPAAYRIFDELGTPTPAPDDLLAVLRAYVSDESFPGVPRAIARACANNLQPAACAIEPQVVETLAWLAEQPEGLAAPLLCGSGACCALFVGDDEAARAIARRATTRGLWSCPARTLAS